MPYSNRRKFLQQSGLALAGLSIVPRHVLGRGYTAPSDQLNLAAIGAGGKGWSDILHAWNNGKENVVALCDVDRNQAGRAINKWPKARFFNDFRKMFDEMGDQIDAVTISTPDHTHAVAAMAAMRRGIHVYVQKPLTHNIAEARRLTKAAREFEIVTQMGNQGASLPAQVQMKEWFDQGLIGTVHTIQVWTNRPVWPQGIPFPQEKPTLPERISAEDWDLFIGPADFMDYHPLFHPFKWRGWWNFGTGALGDMGCHLIDPPFRVLGLGYPTEVECSVGQVFTRDWTPEFIPEGCPPSSRIQLSFPATERNPRPIKMNWSDGGLRPFHPDLIPAEDPLGNSDSTNGVLMIGEKGIMTCGVYGRNPKVYLNSGEKLTLPKDYDGGLSFAKDPEHGHHRYWTEAIKAGYGSAEHQALSSDFDYAGPLTEAVLMGNLAIRSYTSLVKGKGGRKEFFGRQKLLWDGEKMKVTNLKEANQFVSRDYRKGWKLD